jgi:hypothetical protein
MSRVIWYCTGEVVGSPPPYLQHGRKLDSQDTLKVMHVIFFIHQTHSDVAVTWYSATFPGSDITSTSGIWYHFTVGKCFKHHHHDVQSLPQPRVGRCWHILLISLILSPCDCLDKRATSETSYESKEAINKASTACLSLNNFLIVTDLSHQGKRCADLGGDYGE